MQERESFYIARQRPDVDYRHWHKGEQMRYETVDAGTDIYVLDPVDSGKPFAPPKDLDGSSMFPRIRRLHGWSGQNQECVFGIS